MAPAAAPPAMEITNPASSCATAPSFSHRAKVVAPMGAPAPAKPPITAGMMDTTDAITGEPVSKLTALEPP